MPSPPSRASEALLTGAVLAGALPAGAVRRSAERHRANVTTQVTDAVAEEIPVAFVYNGRPHAVMMATPADLEDFALGFSLSEAIIAAPAECEKVEIVPALAGIELRITILPVRAAAIEDRVRELTGRTGCGLCGAQTLDAAVRHPPPVTGDVCIDERALESALDQLGQNQRINAATGATHAAAWVLADGQIALLREDVGRHNALDKLIGAMSGRFTPHGGFLIVTSRASYEMVMKAATVGIGALAAISAPTALAIALAQETQVVLIGFARSDGWSVYTFPQRVTAAAPRSGKPSGKSAR